MPTLERSFQALWRKRSPVSTKPSGRQVRGLLMAAGGAGLALLIVGARDLTGYCVTFLAAVPGFAYGYYEPDGKPVRARKEARDAHGR